MICFSFGVLFCSDKKKAKCVYKSNRTRDKLVEGIMNLLRAA